MLKACQLQFLNYIGGKVTVAAAGEDTPFSASSIVHPA